MYWRITSNTGNGYFSRDWIEYADIEKALMDWPKDLPLTSMALYSLPTLKGKSIDTASFLVASLVKEGILEPVPDRKRHFQITDLSALEKMKVLIAAILILGRPVGAIKSRL